MCPAVDDIGQLFLIEREIAATVDGIAENEARAIRKKIREERSKPIVAASDSAPRRLVPSKTAPLVKR